ncbi:MAG: ABC transporter ATP-binding protein, partial [SAR202 cluster bacterium]|nr:ABC transporter ATP-binding protein [SAR202 cluster bacterium]
GAGKTTLVHIMATLARQDEGVVRVAGHDTMRSASQVRLSTGVLTHQTMLYDHLTVAENLRFYGRMFAVRGLAARISELTAGLDMDAFLHRRVVTLSHGMQKRASLARALLHRPRVLLLDEPESGLDPATLGLLAQALSRHRADGGAVLMTTHRVEEGLALGSRVAILAEGRIAFESACEGLTAEALRERYAQVTGASA